LIEQERNIYNEEHHRLEEDMRRMSKLTEAKIRLIKNKLLPLYNDGGKMIKSDISIDEIIDRIN
jgi:hypothetical protein